MKKKKEKYTFDYSKLKGRIAEKNYTQESLAKEIGIDKATLSIKINNHALFIQDEINSIIKVLDIPSEAIKEYFFKEKV